MAILHCLLSVAGETAGFQLPVFRTLPGANQDLIQKIEHNETISGFEAIVFNQVAKANVDKHMEIEIGEKAVWAFRDHTGRTHIGRADEIRSVTLELLAGGALDHFPMAATEVAAFCGVETTFRHVLINTFNVLRKISLKSADVWRDSVVLLPHIKRELSTQLPARSLALADIKNVIAVSRGSTLHVFGSNRLAASIQQGLPETLEIASVFGVHEYKVHGFPSPKKQPEKPHNSWYVLGIGGIARYVVTQAPFHGSLAGGGLLHNGAIAHGISTMGKRESSIAIGIVPTDRESAHAIRDKAIALGAEARHAVNIRPIGFGTPRADKPSLLEMRHLLQPFRSVWVLSGHRQRQTGNFANDLSASNTASRIAKAVTLGLIESSKRRHIDRILRERWTDDDIGLCGASKFDGTIPLRLMLTRALYALLCAEASLHSAKRIVSIIPSLANTYANRNGEQYSIRLGGKRYELLLFGANTSSVITFATRVKPSEGTDREFAEFCWSLLSGYGWDMQQIDRGRLVLATDGRERPIRVQLAGSDTALAVALDEHDAFHSRDNWLIITNRTITKAVRTAFSKRLVHVIHYSEIDRTMRQVYGRELLLGGTRPQ